MLAGEDEDPAVGAHHVVARPSRTTSVVVADGPPFLDTVWPVKTWVVEVPGCR